MKIKSLMSALLASIAIGLGSLAHAENLVEFRDKGNQFNIYISTPAGELNGALLNAAEVNRGTLPNARLDSSSVTLQGNSFNTANKLVQLDGSTKLPAVDGSQLTNVTATTIGQNSVGSFQIIDGTITVNDMGTDSVGGTQIIDSTVTAADLAADSVGSSEIQTDAVGSAEIATDAVGSAEIAADAVGTSELAATAVTVGTFGTATRASTFTVDQDGRLTAAGDILITPAAASITAGNLAADVVASSVAANIIGTTQVQADSLTAADLAADSVGSSEIATDAVGSAEIATDAVGSAEIAADAVGSSELATTGVTVGTFGSATKASTFTVDADGRMTSAGDVTITPAAGSVTAGTFTGSFTFSSALTVNGFDIRGALSAASLQSTACSAHATVPCMAYNTSDSDLYTSTGTATGSWRNTRTGVAP